MEKEPRRSSRRSAHLLSRKPSCFHFFATPRRLIHTRRSSPSFAGCSTCRRCSYGFPASTMVLTTSPSLSRRYVKPSSAPSSCLLVTFSRYGSSRRHSRKASVNSPSPPWRSTSSPVDSRNRLSSSCSDQSAFSARKKTLSSGQVPTLKCSSTTVSPASFLQCTEKVNRPSCWNVTLSANGASMNVAPSGSAGSVYSGMYTPCTA